MSNEVTRVLVWDENPHHAPKEIYPESINGAVATGLRELGGAALEIKTANLDDPDQGASDAALVASDVLIWWGHARHGQVSDETVERVAKHVHETGLGLIALHSAHYSKVFKAVVGPGHLLGGWRVATPPDIEEITVCAPRHPIAAGVDDFVLPEEEMYGAPFEVPPPITLVLQSYFPNGGEYFPCGVCYDLGKAKFTTDGPQPTGAAGRAFYFRPGHETYPTYFDGNVKRVLYNAVLWCARRT